MCRHAKPLVYKPKHQQVSHQASNTSKMQFRTNWMWDQSCVMRRSIFLSYFCVSGSMVTIPFRRCFIISWRCHTSQVCCCPWNSIMSWSLLLIFHGRPRLAVEGTRKVSSFETQSRLLLLVMMPVFLESRESLRVAARSRSQPCVDTEKGMSLTALLTAHTQPQLHVDEKLGIFSDKIAPARVRVRWFAVVPCFLQFPTGILGIVSPRLSKLAVARYSLMSSLYMFLYCSNQIIEIPNFDYILWLISRGLSLIW